MTERLYYTDAYLRSFEATVADAQDNGRRVYLDRSAFYPTSGGQPHDTGTLAGIDVIDVIDEGDRVAHVLAAPLSRHDVHGEIDWIRRFDHMQQHTGQHLLSAIFEDACGLVTVSVHFGAEVSTLDLDRDAAGPEAVIEVERRANAAVAENRRVDVSFENAQEARGLRKASDREGTLRVIGIEGLDRSACGGTHVRSTAEIGAILLRRHERMKMGARIEFVCGVRAASRARRDFDALNRMARLMSASVDDVPELVETQTANLRDREGRLRRAEAELDRQRAKDRYAAQNADPRGRRWITERIDIAPDERRPFAQAYCELPGAVYLLASTSPPAVLFAASTDSGIDAGQLLKAAMATVGGRGGGSPKLAQGSVPSAADVERVVRALTEA